MRRFKEPQTAFASGWMAVRGARRRGGYERGFVLSDHADWKGLMLTIKQSEAKNLCHPWAGRYCCRYLNETEGLDAVPLNQLESAK